MKKNLMKVFLLVFVLSVLSVSAFAADSSVSVTYVLGAKGSTTGTVTIGSGETSKSDTFSLRRQLFSYSTGTVYMGLGTTTFQLSPLPSGFGVSTSDSGCSVNYTISNGVATIVVSRDTSSSSEIVNLTFTGSEVFDTGSYTVSASGYSFTSSGSGSEETGTPPSHTMQGMQNGQRWVLYDRSEWLTYNQYIGFYNTIATGKNTLTDGSNADVEKNLGWVAIDTLAEFGYNAYSWTIDPDTGALKFSSGALSSSWLDMMWKYQTYNFYWGLQLMTNQTDGNSWFDSVSTQFSYLNYRVNQLFEVLSNDEDLVIKDSTTSEREWVQDYFENGSDIADSSKYNSLNSDGQALKDFLTPSESKSISDAIESVESGGYSFWSDQVYQDLYGSSSLSTADVNEDIPWEQQINDLYSDHVNAIWGAFDD